MDIVIIADFCRTFDGQVNNRFLYIANELTKKGETVEVVSSDFNHGTKSFFESRPTCYDFNITLLHEPYYPTNVCLKRFYSHFIWGLNVLKYLRKRKT